MPGATMDSTTQMAQSRMTPLKTMQSKKITLEICAYSLESAIAAQAGGANRVELCCDPAQGGITPSYGSIVVARQELNVELHVIIRPRGGDFLYSPPDVEVMREDIQLCRRLRSEERRVGKECRSRMAPYHYM